MHRPAVRLLVVCFAILALFSLSSCRIRPRVRTLPEEIQSLNIPMFINLSYEPGLEEVGTRATVEAFLADGRLDVVSRQQADAIVQVVIQSFENEAASTSSDDFSMINTIKVGAVVYMYSPKDRLNPMQMWGPFTESRAFVSDTRRISYVNSEDARQGMMDALALRVVQEVLTGGFRIPEPAPEPESVSEE